MSALLQELATSSQTIVTSTGPVVHHSKALGLYCGVAVGP